VAATHRARDTPARGRNRKKERNPHGIGIGTGTANVASARVRRRLVRMFAIWRITPIVAAHHFAAMANSRHRAWRVARHMAAQHANIASPTGDSPSTHTRGTASLDTYYAAHAHASRHRSALNSARRRTHRRGGAFRSSSRHHAGARSGALFGASSSNASPAQPHARSAYRRRLAPLFWRWPKKKA